MRIETRIIDVGNMPDKILNALAIDFYEIKDDKIYVTTLPRIGGIMSTVSFDKDQLAYMQYIHIIENSKENIDKVKKAIERTLDYFKELNVS